MKQLEHNNKKELVTAYPETKEDEVIITSKELENLHIEYLKTPCPKLQPFYLLQKRLFNKVYTDDEVDALEGLTNFDMREEWDD